MEYLRWVRYSLAVCMKKIMNGLSSIERSDHNSGSGWVACRNQEFMVGLGGFGDRYRVDGYVVKGSVVAVGWCVLHGFHYVESGYHFAE